MAQPRYKRERLLKDENVERWYHNLSRGSPITAEVNLRRLSLFCELNHTSPQHLVEVAKATRKKAEDMILDTVTRMETEKRAPGYIAGIVKAVKSWLKYNDAGVNPKVKISNLNATPSIEDERVPKQEELKIILIYASERAKVSIAFMAFAGLRPETIGDESGTDGLTLRDLPDIKIEEGRVSFTKIPAMVVVRPPLSKNGHRYFTFLSREGCDYLAAYLEKRVARGEKIGATSSIVAVSPGYEQMGRSERNRGSQFITTRNVTREIREAMRPRFAWRPYVLRAYCDTQMLLAENQGKIAPAYRSFFMGHSGDIEARYTTHKGCLPEQMVEDMRKSFGRCEEYLSSVPAKPVVDGEKVKKESLLAIAKILGFPQETLDKVQKDVDESEYPTADKVVQLLTDAAAGMSASFFVRKATDTKKQESAETNGKPYEGKIVNEKEIVPYIEDGWEILKELKDGKFLIKRSNHVNK